jgi:uncharacterized membrane protein YfcA
MKGKAMITHLADIWPLLALLTGVGAVAGVLAGLLGIGGGLVLVPAFFYVFTHLGYAGPQLMQICVGTSLATIVLTSMRSVQAHHRKGAVDWAILRRWLPFVVLGAGAGVWIAAQISSVAMQFVFGILAGLAGLYMAFGRAEWRLGAQMPALPVQGTWAFGAGLGSALMGIGGGTFAVPIMTLYGVPIHRAVATASGVGVLIALPATAGFMLLDVAIAPPLTLGAVNWAAFVAVSIGTMVTAPWGAALAHKTNPKPLKRMFALFITLVALNMLRKALGF